MVGKKKQEALAPLEDSKYDFEEMDSGEMDSGDDEDEEGEMMMGGGGEGMLPIERIFFCEIVTEKKPLVVPVPDDPWRLIITQATLGETGAPDGTRVTLKCGIGKASTVIGHFRGGEVEMIPLCGLQFPCNQDAAFSIAVSGKKAAGVEVHVAGFFEGADLGPMSDSEDDEESDEDEMEGSIDDEEEEEEDEEDDDEDMMGGMHFGRVGESGNRLVKARVVKGESEEIEEILTPGAQRSMGMKVEDAEDDMDEDEDDEEGEVWLFVGDVEESVSVWLEREEEGA